MSELHREIHEIMTLGNDELFIKFDDLPQHALDSYERLIDYIKATAPQTEWISVAEGMPETDQHIIMCNEHGDRFSGRGSVLIQTNLSPEPYTGRRSRYTHWMPMPPSPKGK